MKLTEVVAKKVQFETEIKEKIKCTVGITTDKTLGGVCALLINLHEKPESDEAIEQIQKMVQGIVGEETPVVVAVFVDLANIG